MLVVPLFSARFEALRSWHRRHPTTLLILGLTLLAWSAAALTLPMPAAQPLLITALMLVAWTAVRFGPPVAAFATLTMSLVMTAGVGMRLGPLAASSPIENIGLQWGFIALLSLTGLSLTALLAERRRDLDELKIVAERYQRLFKSNPSPLWVAEPNGGHILMVNDEALRHYGFTEAEFLAMTVAELTFGVRHDPDHRVEPRCERRRQQYGPPPHPRGKIIDVILVSTPIELDGRAAELCYAVDVTDRLELRSRILTSMDLERVRLAQELHDGLGQVLTGLSLGARAAAGARLTRCAHRWRLHRLPRRQQQPGGELVPTVDSGRFAPSGREWRPSGGAASPSQYGATRFRTASRGSDRVSSAARPFARALRTFVPHRAGGCHQCAEARARGAYRRARHRHGGDRPSGCRR